jgi:hypothetical protein
MIKYRFAEGKAWDHSVAEDVTDDDEEEGEEGDKKGKRTHGEQDGTHEKEDGGGGVGDGGADRRPMLINAKEANGGAEDVDGESKDVEMHVLGMTPEASMLLRLTKVPVHELVLIDPEDECRSEQEAQKLAHDDAFWGTVASDRRAQKRGATPAKDRGTKILTSGLTIVAEESPGALILGLKARPGARWTLNPALLGDGPSQMNVDQAIGTVVIVGFKEVTGSAIVGGKVHIGDELAAVNGIPVVRDVVSGHGQQRSFEESSKLLQEEKGRSAAARKMLVLKFVRTTTATTPIDGRGMSRRLRTKNPELERQLQQQQASRQGTNAWQNAGDANRFNLKADYFDVECAPGPLGINFRPSEDGSGRMKVASFCQTKGATQRGGRVGIGHVLARVGSTSVPLDGGEESLALARQLLQEANVPCTLVFRDPEPELAQPSTSSAEGAGASAAGPPASASM